MNLKFFADVHISPITVEELKKHGYEVIRITERLSSTATDLEIINLAYEENAIIITQDLDFSALIVKSGLRGPSIITLRISNPKPIKVAEILIKILPRIKEALIEGSLVTIDDFEYRIKKLPI